MYYIFLYTVFVLPSFNGFRNKKFRKMFIKRKYKKSEVIIIAFQNIWYLIIYFRFTVFFVFYLLSEIPLFSKVRFRTQVVLEYVLDYNFLLSFSLFFFFIKSKFYFRLTLIEKVILLFLFQCYK